MKILQINTVFKCGGSTGKIVNSLKNLNSKDIETYVAYAMGEKPKNIYQYKTQSFLERKWAILQTRLFAEHGFYNVKETERLLAWISEVSPDIIHLHNIHNHYINVELLFEFLKKRNIPVVWTLHDCWSFTGWCAYFDRIQCNKWKKGCYKCANRKEYPYSWIIDKSEINFKKKCESFQSLNNLTLVTPSLWLKQLVKQSFLKDYETIVINNGIDLSLFRPRETNKRYNLGIDKDKKIILALADRIDKRKGIYELIELSKLLSNKYYLLIVGIDKLNINTGNVICIKRTENQNELVDLYNIADVFINPTLEDNFPTTNLEALACGVPVITYKTGGSVEAVDESTGVVLKNNTVDELWNAIQYIIIQGKKKYSYRCVQRAERLYDERIMVQRYLNLYNELYQKYMWVKKYDE